MPFVAAILVDVTEGNMPKLVGLKLVQGTILDATNVLLTYINIAIKFQENVILVSSDVILWRHITV